MVKNTSGGTRTKGLARKHQSRGDSRLRLPDDELEQVACVTKMLGNRMCEIHTSNNERLIGHIRNKFTGRHKRHNLITISSVVLIGLREWENPIKNCDILTIYDDSQINQLKNMPNIAMDNVLRLRNELSNMGQVNITEEFDFTNGIEENEEEELQNTMRNTESFTMGNMGKVDIDDI
jgi:translation initiation factor IF-1|tara:strand:- start:1245 stop:1778 length:534 start_codon:yes stop_codon:yes gene_type:complete